MVGLVNLLQCGWAAPHFRGLAQAILPPQLSGGTMPQIVYTMEYPHAGLIHPGLIHGRHASD